jgi:tRNA dimethylallyltransferase
LFKSLWITFKASLLSENVFKNVPQIRPLKTEEKTLVVITGPTAVGKTALAVQVAKLFQTEIISADSRQIFKELTIGTAKPSVAELQEVPHHFINTHSIHQQYDAAHYGEEALRTIHHLFEHHAVAILCGGSGLYIKAVCEGFDDIPQIPETIREGIIQQYHTHGLAWLQREVQEKDAEYFKTMDQQNPHRLIRALEIKIGTGMSMAFFRGRKKSQHDFAIVKIGLELPREELFQRINHRMDAMIAEGLFEEAEQLFPFKAHNALQTVGYQEIFNFMDGQYDRGEAIRLLKRNSRRYAKRQLTWFKKDAEITWFNAHDIRAIIQYLKQKVGTLPFKV